MNRSALTVTGALKIAESDLEEVANGNKRRLAKCCGFPKILLEVTQQNKGDIINSTKLRTL